MEVSFPFPHILSRISSFIFGGCVDLFHSDRGKKNLKVVLTWISLITWDDEYCFSYFPVGFISSLKKALEINMEGEMRKGR